MSKPIYIYEGESNDSVFSEAWGLAHSGVDGAALLILFGKTGPSRVSAGRGGGGADGKSRETPRTPKRPRRLHRHQRCPVWSGRRWAWPERSVVERGPHTPRLHLYPVLQDPAPPLVAQRSGGAGAAGLLQRQLRGGSGSTRHRRPHELPLACGLAVQPRHSSMHLCCVRGARLSVLD